MKQYQKRNRFYYFAALTAILISTLFAVVLQFFKGKILDSAARFSIQQSQATALQPYAVCCFCCFSSCLRTYSTIYMHGLPPDS